MTRPIDSIGVIRGGVEQSVALSSLAFVAGGSERTVQSIEVNRGEGGTTPPSTETRRWAGHQPGRIYLGFSASPEATFQARLAEVGLPIGVRRHFHGWNEQTEEMSLIAQGRSRGEIAWTSFTGPANRTVNDQEDHTVSWEQIADGQHDDTLAARFTRYATSSTPVIVTYDHEASGKYEGMTDAQAGALWAAATSRIYDVAVATLGPLPLSKVCLAPIQGDWLFNPRNSKNEASHWVPASLLSRINAHGFFGIDLYHNASQDNFEVRFNRIFNYFASLGFPDVMVGVGETGATSAMYPQWSKTATQFWSQNWAWAAAHPDRIGVISYFNSMANSKDYVYWPLDEEGVAAEGEGANAKMDAYRAALRSPVATTLASL